MRSAITRILVVALTCGIVLGATGMPRAVSATAPTAISILASSSSGTPLDDIGFVAAMAPSPANGTLEWSVDGAVVASSPIAEDGTSAWSTHFALGAHSVAAGFSGDADLEPSTSDPVEVMIDVVPTTTSLAVNPDPVEAGSPALLTASVSPVPDPVAGHIEWLIDGVVSGTTEIAADGTASHNQSWADPGTHTVMAGFVEGTIWADSQSAPTAVTVSPRSLSISAAPSDPITLVGTSTLEVSVTPNPGAGTVKVYTGSTLVTAAPLGTDGKASPSVEVANGTNSYSIDFIPAGATYVAASASATIEGREYRPTLSLTANRTTAVSAETLVTFTVSPDQYDALGQGTMIISDDFGGQTKIVGPAGVSIDAPFRWVLSTKVVGVGTHHVSASFSGDASFASAESGVLAISVTADVGVAASGVGRSYATFYPYKDGYRDTVAIRGTPGEPVSVSVKVYSSSGSRIRSWTLSTRSTPWVINWTGRNASGTRQPAGKYKVVQKLRDKLGHTKSYTSYTNLSNKRLYWHTGTQTKYADTGAFGWSGDASAEYSNELGSRGIFLYGGFCNYDDQSGQDVCDFAFGRHRFTLPAAAVYSTIRFSVAGLSWENMGTGHLGVENYTTGAMDGVRAIGYSYGWYSTPSALGSSGHVSSSRIVTTYVWVEGGPYPPGSTDYLKVRLTYRYGVLG